MKRDRGNLLNLIRAAEFRRVFLRRIILPELKRHDTMGLQIEPFYDPLRIHHAANQIDH
jgi:hypothetical protein